MTSNDWNRDRGVVKFTAPDRSYAIIRDCSGGDRTYFHDAHTIKSLDLDSRANKRVSFIYKRDEPMDMTHNHWNWGIVTYLAPDLSYLAIKSRFGGGKAYLRNAHGTIKRLGLDNEAIKWVRYRCEPDRPTEVRETEKVER